jgi:hypothetical protein
LKTAQANSSQNPIPKKKKITKEGWWMAQGVGPEFKPQYHKNKTNKQKIPNHWLCFLIPVLFPAPSPPALAYQFNHF